MDWNIKSNDHINNCFVSLDFIFSPWMPLYQLLHHGCRSFTFVQDDALPFVITQNGGRKRIFILFFCVIPPSQYPPSGFAGHLLINKEACPIPILPVRIPFLNTVANPLLTLWMTPYRPSSFWAEIRMLCEKDGKRNGDAKWRIYYSDDTLTSYTRIMESVVRRSCGARSAIEDTRLS